MKKYSIEYAHIYTNESPEKEHALYVESLHQIITNYGRENISLMIMVDDYSFPDPSFDYNKFLSGLTLEEIHPDICIRESTLIPYCDELIGQIENKKMKKEITDYIVSTKKYPCSLFIATWYLIRLGKIPSHLVPIEHTAENLINILPENFQTFEEKGLEIIKSTPYKYLIPQIENQYFEGRIIF